MEPIANGGLRELVYQELGVRHEKPMKRRARKHMFARDARREAVSKAGELDDEAVRHGPRAQDIRNSSYALVADECDLDGMAAARGPHKRDDPRLGEIRPFRAFVGRSKPCSPME